tara:strand:- start:352 stop:576 length:225 start_codon:yes stop_codon:yes gene_type:complete
LQDASRAFKTIRLDNPLHKSAVAKKGSSILERRFDRRGFEIPSPQKSRNKDDKSVSLSPQLAFLSNPFIALGAA